MKQCWVIFLIILIGCVSKPSKMECKDIESIKASIKKQYKADKIEITSQFIKEEIYFPAIRSINITLHNPKTRTLDFKTLPTDRYQRFENYEEIENRLKKEGVEIFNLIKENCNLNEFNEVIVIFGKSGENDPLLYDFIVHYKL